jgi:hypothetical protein
MTLDQLVARARCVIVAGFGVACGARDPVAVDDAVPPLISIVISPADTVVAREAVVSYRASISVPGTLAWASADTMIAGVIAEDALAGTATLRTRQSGRTDICVSLVTNAAVKGCAILRVSE